MPRKHHMRGGFPDGERCLLQMPDPLLEHLVGSSMVDGEFKIDTWNDNHGHNPVAVQIQYVLVILGAYLFSIRIERVGDQRLSLKKSLIVLRGADSLGFEERIVALSDHLFLNIHNRRLAVLVNRIAHIRVEQHAQSDEQSRYGRNYLFGSFSHRVPTEQRTWQDPLCAPSRSAVQRRGSSTVQARFSPILATATMRASKTYHSASANHNRKADGRQSNVCALCKSMANPDRGLSPHQLYVVRLHSNEKFSLSIISI